MKGIYPRIVISVTEICHCPRSVEGAEIQFSWATVTEDFNSYYLQAEWRGISHNKEL